MGSRIYFLWLEYLGELGICQDCAQAILDRKNINVLTDLFLDHNMEA